MLKEIAMSLASKGEHRLVRELHRVTAFDARVALYSDGYKFLYLLDAPIFDKTWELLCEDGSKKLITDQEATDILKAERELNEKVKENALDQIKRVNKFSKFGGIKLDPELEKELAVNPNLPTEVHGPAEVDQELKPKKKKD